jgi:transcriptional regulator with XRE-family HTH domain
MPNSNGDRERELHRLLQYLLDRDLTQRQLIEALGISRSTYNDQRRENRLANAENLINAAQHFGLNPVELLCRYGHVTIDDAMNFCQKSPLVTRGFRTEDDPGDTPTPPP